MKKTIFQYWAQRIFLGTILVFLFGLGMFTVAIPAEASIVLETPVATVDEDAQKILIEKGSEQCSLFEYKQLSKGKKKAVFRNLTRKKRLILPGSVREPMLQITKMRKPDDGTPFVSEEDFLQEEAYNLSCPRAP